MFSFFKQTFFDWVVAKRFLKTQVYLCYIQINCKLKIARKTATRKKIYRRLRRYNIPCFKGAWLGSTTCLKYLSGSWQVSCFWSNTREHNLLKTLAILNHLLSIFLCLMAKVISEYKFVLPNSHAIKLSCYQIPLLFNFWQIYLLLEHLRSWKGSVG